MTPTSHTLDEALPPVPSGISALGGDLTEPDEPGSDRAVALDWLEKFYAEAHELGRKQALTEITEIAERVGAENELQHCDSGLDAVLPAGNPESGPEVPQERQSATQPAIPIHRNEVRTYDQMTVTYRDPHEVLDGDRWEVRNGRAVIVGSNDWPGPAKGTHESDLGFSWATCGDYPLPGEDQEHGRGGNVEFDLASAWSHDELPRRPSRTPDPQEAT